MKAKSFYLAIVVCCVSMLALAGRNSDMCKNESKCKMKKDVAIEKEEKSSVTDLLSPLQFLVLSL